MKKLVTIVALSLSIAGVGSVGAATKSTYPGSMCKAWQGTFQLNWSTIENATATTTNVDCPVGRVGSSISSGYFRVRDLSSTDSVQCGLESVFVSGSQIFFWESRAQSPIGFSTAWTQLNFASVPADPVGYYFYSCSIPGTSTGLSALANYSVTEI